MAQENTPIFITQADCDELDRLADRLNYQQARRQMGFLPLEREIQVVEIQPAARLPIKLEATVEDEIDETRQQAIERAKQLGNHPDDNDWRFR